MSVVKPEKESATLPAPLNRFHPADVEALVFSLAEARLGRPPWVGRSPSSLVAQFSEHGRLHLVVILGQNAKTQHVQNLTQSEDKPSDIIVIDVFEREHPVRLPAELQGRPTAWWRAEEILRQLRLNPQLGAWLQDGDITAGLLDGARLRTLLARHLVADQYSRLSAAGGDKHRRSRLARVFVDLPIHVGDRATTFGRWMLGRVARARVDSLFGAPTPASRSTVRPHVSLLVGGPGQGKTTLGVWLCQLHRAAILSDSPGLEDEAQAVLDDLSGQPTTSPTQVLARRLPWRVVLYRYAHALAAGKVTDLWDFLALECEEHLGEPVPKASLVAWLTTWPTLLVLDGLDEVSASANRAEVLASLYTFMAEINEVPTADLSVLATTRPQGYRGELDWPSAELQPLSSELAVNYADRVIAELFRGDPIRAREVKGRLVAAVGDPVTGQLARSPLQVTILTILAEQSGRPPRDRWRLFREYFRIIYDREKDRGIPSVEVLNELPELVERLHAEVGYRLQLEAERAEGVASGMSRAEFLALTREMLTNDQHEAAEVERQAQRIGEALTERLVFLVGLGEDAVGFEIRSLQEYAAAERLFHGEEPLILRRLEALLPSAHWRNVLLFAAGRLAADRGHLLDKLPALLFEAEGDVRLSGLSARVALVLLEEGWVAAKPRVRDALVQGVMDRLDLMDGDLILELGKNASFKHEVLVPELARQIPGPNEWGAMAGLLDLYEGLDGPLAEQVRTAGEGRPELVVEHVYGLVRSEERPATLAWARRLAPRVDPVEVRGAVGLLRDLNDAADVSVSMGAPSGHRASMWSIHAGVRFSAVGTSANWSPFRSINTFQEDPTPRGLVRALEQLDPEASRAARELASYWAPWPLEVCLISSVRLPELIRQIEAGSLGTDLDWHTAETRWGEHTLEIGELLMVPANGLPFGREIARVGAASISMPWTDSDFERVGGPEGALLTSGFPLTRIALDLAGRCLLDRAASAPLDWVSTYWQQCATWSREKRAIAPTLYVHPAWITPDTAGILADTTRARRADRGWERSTDVAVWAALVPHLDTHPALVAWAPVLGTGSLILPYRSPDPRNFLPDQPALAADALLLRLAAGLPEHAPELVRLATELSLVLPAFILDLSQIFDRLRVGPVAEAFLLAWLPAYPDPKGLLRRALRRLVEARLSRLHRPEIARALALPVAKHPPPPERATRRSPPVAVRRIVLKDLRGWASLDLTLDRRAEDRGQWIFFIGPNGVGKSSVLRAVALALASPGVAQGLLNDLPGPAVRLGAGVESAHIGVTLSLDDRAYVVNISESADLRVRTLSSKGQHNELFLVGYGPRRGTVLGVTRQDIKLGPESELATLFKEGESLIHAESWLKTLHHRATSPDPAHPDDAAVFERVCEVITELLPGVSGLHVTPDAVEVAYEGLGKVPLAAVSDGYLTTAGWLVDLLARWIERERAAGRRVGPDFAEEMTGLVLIDEVDLNLHPRWQWSLVDRLRGVFKRLSFMVTTHNPVTLLGSEAGEVLVLHRDSTGRVHATPCSIPLGGNVDRILTGEWFDLPTTVDRETAGLLDEHRQLLREGVNGQRLHTLEAELRRRLGDAPDTRMERLAARAVAEELAAKADEVTGEERARGLARARAEVAALLRGAR